MSAPAPIRRYVALGDSSTEGLDDPDGQGGHRGWADRLAARLAAAYPGLRYANLAVRSRSAAEIAATQLAPAVAMRPDLATVVAGMNDLLRRDYDAARVAAEVGAMQRALIAGGARVITFTLPDVSARMRLGARMAARTTALNAALREVCAATGAHLLDLAALEVARDPRLWSDDRLHANALGHARLADALAHQLALPGADDGWAQPLPPAPLAGRGQRAAADVRWLVRHVAPWAWRKVRGRSAGDRVTAKRPVLTPVEP
ncbi:MAG: SGNH/GDSL hydrolase family protein [Kofleriaceae bacterium]